MMLSIVVNEAMEGGGGGKEQKSLYQNFKY